MVGAAAPGSRQATRSTRWVVHGSPRDEDEYMIFRGDVVAALYRRRAWLTLCGHTHWQAGWSLEGPKVTLLKPVFQSGDRAEQFELKLHEGNRYLLNPGSSGSLVIATGERLSPYTTTLRPPLLVPSAVQSARSAKKDSTRWPPGGLSEPSPGWWMSAASERLSTPTIKKGRIE